MLVKYSIYTKDNTETPRTVFVTDEKVKLEAHGGPLALTVEIPPLNNGANSARTSMPCRGVLCSQSNCFAFNEGDVVVQNPVATSQVFAFMAEIGTAQATEKRTAVVIPFEPSRATGRIDRFLERFRLFGLGRQKDACKMSPYGCESCSPGSFPECAVCENGGAK